MPDDFTDPMSGASMPGPGKAPDRVNPKEPGDTRAISPAPEGGQKVGPEKDEEAESNQEEAEGDGEWHRLTSSNVYSMRYQKAQSVLQVMFKGGRLHEYPGVSADDAEGLKTASSPGRWIWDHFRR